MPDIKLKPQMDKPKVPEVIRAPKEAGSILKEQYEAQQERRRPTERGPVQYATDRVERSAQQGAVLAGREIRRSIKKRNTDPKTQTEQGADTKSCPTQTHQPPVREPKEQERQQFIRTRQQECGKGSAARPEKLIGTQQPSVRERGRLKAIGEQKAKTKACYLAEKEKAAARGLQSTTEQAAHTPIRMKQKAVAAKTGRPAIRSVPGEKRLKTPAAIAAKRAKQATQRKMQRQMLQQATVKAKKAAQETAKIAVRLAKATAWAIAAAAKAIVAAGGGVALLVAIVLVAIIAAIAASPFGIFFSGENTGPDAVPVSAAMAELDNDFNAQLEIFQGGGYDDVVIHGAAADRAEVLAVFASKVAGADGSDAADVVTLDRVRIEKLKAVFWDMTEISSEVEIIEHGDSDPDDETDDSWTENILHITVTAKTAEEMPALYGFTPRQTSSMAELLAQRAMLTELIGNLTILSADADAVLDALPDDLAPERKAVIKAACSLVGKVNYFWGGKSLTIGWDTRWGTLQKVWADGSSTTGTYHPYGLDCSGFADWVFYNATDGAYYPGHGGGAAMQHSYCTDIPWADAQPGDLVFYPDDSHVGIVGGRDESGNLLIIHCASGYNNVVVTGTEGFAAVGRPNYYLE